MKKILIILILLLAGITVNAQTNYYVKNGGSDAKDGKSDANAWATLGKADDVTFVPGDTLFLARGSTWKEKFEPQGDGTSDSTLVVIRDYGTGAKPIITGRDTISGSSRDANWTETSGGSGHWYFSVTGMGFSVDNPINRLWINNVEKRRSETLLLLTATDLFFYDSTTDRLYIHSTPNPGTLTNIEAGNVRTRAVNLYGDNYFKFYNIDFQGGMYSVRITGSSDGIVLDSCNIGLYTPGYGVATGDATGSVDDITIQNCTFDSGMEIKYEIASFYIPWTGIQIQNTGDNWEVSHNYFKNWDYAAFTFIYVAGYDLTNLNFHHNEITSPDTYEGKALGISSPNGGTQEYHHNYIHNVGVGCQMTGVGWKFYTNVIDTVRGAPIFSAIVSQCGIIISPNTLSDCKGIQVVNNTFANCQGAAIYLGQNSSTSGTENTENEFINNILHNNGATDNDEQIRIRSFSNIHTNTFKNNLLYSTGITDLVKYRDTLMTVTEFNARNSNAFNEVILNNITGDPLFSGSTFLLTETSPAVNTGIDVWLTTDYAGTAIPQGNYFDIGAYEFSAFPITTSGLGWEDILSKRNFKDDVNFAQGFSVEGVPIVFSGGEPVNIPGLTASASELNILDGATVSTTEINYSDGVTSAIQTQIDSKVNKSDTLVTTRGQYYTQRQIDSLALLKAPLASPTFTGIPQLPTAAEYNGVRMDSVFANKNSTTRIFNILDYGAVSDDGLSDVSAIQAAINAVYDSLDVESTQQSQFNNLSGTVYIPDGNWLIDAPDTIKGHVVILCGRNARIKSTHNGPVWVADQKEDVYNAKIIGGHYEGPFANQELISSDACIDMSSTDIQRGIAYSMFSDMSIQGYSYGIKLKFSGTGWCNANSLSDIYMDKNRVYLDVDGNRNIFNNVLMQRWSNTQYDTMVIINGDANKIYGEMFDLQETDSTLAVYLGSSTNDNILNITSLYSADTLYTKDYGYNNKFLESSDGVNVGGNLIVQSQLSDGSTSGEININSKRVSPYNVINGTQLGQINFNGWHDDAFYQGAQIRAVVSQTPLRDSIISALYFNVTDQTGAKEDYFRVYNDEVQFYKPLTSSTNNTTALGLSYRSFSDLYLGDGAVISLYAGDVTLTHSANLLTLGGGDLALGTNKITQSGVNLSEQHTIKKIIGWHGATGCDFLLPDIASHGDNPTDLGGIIPAKAKVTRIDIVCTEAFTAAGAIDITVAAGNVTGGAQYIAALSCDDLNEVIASTAVLTDAVLMDWTAHAHVWINSNPDVNYDTMTAGKVTVYITYIEYTNM